MNKIEKIVKNISKNMLIYTLIIIIIGILVGYMYSLNFLSKYISIIVFLMIYPMMVNISFESLKKIKTSQKAIITALFFNFIVAPILYLLLSILFKIPQNIKITLLLLAVSPSSSMGLGYVGISKGNIVSASIIVASAFILSLIVYPITIHFLNIGYHLVPFTEIIKSLVFVLILPLILGLVTREGLIEKKGLDIKKVKPYFSLVTLISLFILIFVIFALKGQLIIKHWKIVVLISPVVIIFYILMMVIAIIFNKYIVKLDYANNQSILFTSVSKNVALTIGLLVTIFGKKGQSMAMYPAIISIFQIFFLMTYLHFSEPIKKWYNILRRES